MFSECTNLKTAKIKIGRSEGYANFMFNNCGNLVELDVTEFNTSGITNMECMFRGCKLLTTLDVSHFDTGNVDDRGCMFYECESLTTLDVSNFNTQNVTDIS